ncbi:hypothetical protein HZS_5693 [Henneguya salminicola]|nr:hypothetical protein HZS_5693 [Henneguya salminicola]
MFESILFISSNVGSLFEYNRKLYLPWRKATSDFIDRKNASLIILTMQEFGGKNILAWDDADFFLKGLYEHFSSDYSTFVCFVDCDMKSENNFTVIVLFSNNWHYALFSILTVFFYFCYLDNKYTGFEAGYHVHQLCQISGMALKIKFPIELFPNGKWSRKGYMINRLRFGGLFYSILFKHRYSIDVVNLHLIHDSNFFLLINSVIPFLYKSPRFFKNIAGVNYNIFWRRNSIKLILRLDQLKSINTVLCGDFNFRTSLSQLLNSFDKEYTFESDQELSNNDTCVARDLSDRNTLASVSSNELRLSNSLLPVDRESFQKHKKSDLEFESFKEQEYLRYDSYGEDIVLGDHKPVSVELPFDMLKTVQRS